MDIYYEKIGLATAVLLAMTGAHAYQVELQGQSEYINSKGFENSYTGDGQGTFYFKDVDASKGPLAEAAFLNKASNVQVGYHFDRQKEFNNTSTSEKLNLMALKLKVTTTLLTSLCQYTAVHHIRTLT